MDVIQSGLRNPDSGVGAYACDPEAYAVFAALFDPIIEDYHGFKKTDVHPPKDFGDVDTLGNLDPAVSFFAFKLKWTGVEWLDCGFLSIIKIFDKCKFER